MTIALDVIKDTLIDSLKTLPFLFLAFLLLEALERHAGERINNTLRSAGKAGPLLGSLLGCIPQCGFSVFAANLYSGGVITLGTLLAVFLATSDEALIILVSEPSRGKDILLLLLFKIIIGITAGYIVDLFVKKHPEKEKHDIGDICKGEHCHCDEHKGIFVPALTHTLKVFGFLLVFTLALNFAIELLGADRLSEILLGNTFFQPLIAALIGLIPNCAASVLLTEMYLGGALSFASVIAGLCSGAGIGLMVLFRTNKKPRENLKILGLLYGISAFSGVIIEIFTKLMA